MHLTARCIQCVLKVTIHKPVLNYKQNALNNNSRSLHAQPFATCESMLNHSQRGGMWRQPFVNRVALCKYSVYYHYSLAKQHAWAEHHTSLPKRGVCTLLNVSALNHKKALMSCLKRLDAFQRLLSWSLHKWREGCLLLTSTRKITSRHFNWMLQSSSEWLWCPQSK